MSGPWLNERHTWTERGRGVGGTMEGGNDRQGERQRGGTTEGGNDKGMGRYRGRERQREGMAKGGNDREGNDRGRE